MHTGFTQDEIAKEIETKKTILEWMITQNIRNISDVGMLMAQYYNDEETIVSLAKANKKPGFLKEK